MTENWIDIVILGIMALSVMLGIWRGFFNAVFGILSLVLGFYAAKQHGALLSPAMRSLLGDTPLALAISYVGVFLVVLAAFHALTHLLRRALRKLDLGGFDRFGGALFGAARGLLFSMIFVLTLAVVGVGQTQSWAESQTVPHVGASLQQLMKTPFLRTHRRWLRFDGANRPSVVYSPGKASGKTKAAALALKRAAPAKQRDRELDEVTTELASQQQFGKGNEADKQAMTAYEERQQSTPLQRIVETVKAMLCEDSLARGEDCESQ